MSPNEWKILEWDVKPKNKQTNKQPPLQASETLYDKTENCVPNWRFQYFKKRYVSESQMSPLKMVMFIKIYTLIPVIKYHHKKCSWMRNNKAHCWKVIKVALGVSQQYFMHTSTETSLLCWN